MAPSSSSSTRRTHFVLGPPGAAPLAVHGQVASEPFPSSLAFSMLHARPLPLAWLSGRLPFARMALGSAWEPPASMDTLMKQLLSDEEEPQPAARRGGHSDEWYAQRCVFCADCRQTVTSQYQKRGSRCTGCRRWFHSGCLPAAASSAASASASGDGADTEQQQSDGAGQRISRSASRRHAHLYFHSTDCQQVYDRLAAMAAAGEQVLARPPKPFWALTPPWAAKEDAQQQQFVRLLNLAELRRLYLDAQKRGTLFKQHKKAQQQVAAAADAAAARAAAASKRGWGFGGGSGSGSSAAAAGDAAASAAAGSGSVRRGPASSLDDFLVAAELLKPLGEVPRDVLEDSFALITRLERDGPACVATFNVYGGDHARLQGLATAGHMQRQGHATRLLGHLESLLADAGVAKMVVLLEPEATLKDEQRVAERGLLPHDTGARWFKEKRRYKPVSSEQAMMWRLELPDYHKALVGTTTLLVKPLILPTKRGWFGGCRPT